MIHGNGLDSVVQDWTTRSADEMAATLSRAARVPFLW